MRGLGRPGHAPVRVSWQSAGDPVLPSGHRHQGHQGHQGSLRVTGEITMMMMKCDKWLDIGLSQDTPSGLKARGLDVVKIGRRPMLLLQTCLM